MRLYPALLGLHVLSITLWLGSLVSITRVLSAGNGQADAARVALAQVARRIYRTVASVWMGLAVVSGFAMVAVLHGQQFRHGFFHAKLTAAVLLVGAHFVIGSRVRKAESGGLTDEIASSTRGLQLAVLGTAAATIFCAVVWKGSAT